MDELFSLQLTLTRDDAADYQSDAVHMLRHPTGEDVLAHAEVWLREVEDVDTLDVELALSQLQHRLEADGHDDISEQLAYFEDGQTDAIIRFTAGFVTVVSLDLVE